MSAALWAFAGALLAGALIFYGRGALGCAMDAEGGGPQKFHSGKVPRIGGAALMTGVLAGVLGLAGAEMMLVLILVVASLPAYGAGMVEDLTKRVSVKNRLVCSFAAAALGFVLIDARVTDLDLPGGALFEVASLSFLFTLFAVGGFAHALNIVDGFNGLAGMVALAMLAALAVVAAQVGDAEVLTAALVIGGAVLGFLVWNFPKGLIFAGDSGAYLLGFMIAVLAVLLTHRNPEISPWFPLLLLIYPVVETFFSMYRKKLLKGRSPGEPDGVHLHMLVHKRLVRDWQGPKGGWKSNALTTPYLVALATLAVVPATLFWHDTVLLQALVVLFVMTYVGLYWSIVRFRTPRFLVLRRLRVPAVAPQEAGSREGGQA